MAVLDHDCSFQRWKLTDEEELHGTILTTNQKQCIQNQIVQAAEEKIALTFDANNTLLFAQREAELQGRINALKYLIDCSNAAEIALAETQAPQ